MKSVESRDLSIGNRLLLLAGVFLAGLILLSVLLEAGLLGNQNERIGVLISSTVQDILVFILPAVTIGYLQSRSGARFLGLDSAPTTYWIAVSTALYFLLMPVVNYLAELNQQMSLPASMKGIEQAMRTMEADAERISNLLLSETSIPGMIVTILIVGVLTGFSEELFFRGATQGTLRRCGVGPQIAVWVTALIFSAVHFQFFGFVPRLLLGALFGYLYLWSGSIWVCAYTHALNNSCVVFTTWMINRGYWNESASNAGADPVMAAVSVLISGLLVWWVLKRRNN